MAAQPWAVYNKAKRFLMDGTIDINAAGWRMALFTSASNAAGQLSAKAEVTNEVAEGNGYSSSGKPLTGITWSTGASAGVMRFNCAPIFWSAGPGDIINAKFAVIFDPASGKVLERCQLSATQFNVTAGNRLTITPSTAGLFELK